jgi:hypothetical protein
MGRGPHRGVRSLPRGWLDAGDLHLRMRPEVQVLQGLPPVLTNGNAASVSGVHWRGVCRSKNSCLVTVACPGPDGYEPRVSTSQNGWMRASPKVCVGPPTALVLVAGSRPVGPLSEVLSSLLAMTSRSVAANTTSWISQNAGHPQADEIASFDQHRSPNLAQGLSAGHRGGKASCWV